MNDNGGVRTVLAITLLLAMAATAITWAGYAADRSPMTVPEPCESPTHAHAGHAHEMAAMGATDSSSASHDECSQVSEVETAPSKPRLALDLATTLTAADTSAASLRQAFNVDEGYEGLEARLCFTGAGILDVRVTGPGGAPFYEYAARVASAGHGAAPSHRAEATAGEYLLEVRALGSVSMWLEVRQHPDHDPGTHPMDH